MTWFKVDDSFAFHSKAVAAGTSLATWVRCGAWCSQQLTDGFVPAHMLTTMGTLKDARKLVAVGLWDEVPGGYSFHDWGSYQPLRAEVEERRRVRAEAGAKGGKASGSARGASKTQASAEASASTLLGPSFNPRPVPSRPSLSSVPEEVPEPLLVAVEAAVDPFDEWWAAYPRKDDKVKARAAYARVLKTMPAAELLASTRGFSFHQDPKFIPLPTSWLNGRRWEDQGAVAPRPRSRDQFV